MDRSPPQRELILEELFRQHDADSYTLPPQKSGVEDWLEWLHNWLEQFRPERQSELPDLTEFLLAAAYTLGFVIVAFLTCYLAISLYRRYGARPTGVDRDPSAAPPQPTVEELVRAVAQALGEGDIARAARLRWKLFLQRSGRPPHLTPLEYTSAAPADTKAAGLLEQALWQVYRLMFAEGGEPKKLFDQMDQSLSRAEEAAHHA